jgi:hypothetical protein|tara:strand:- start:75 stop:2621 length:2547 start_codon:yes stop_codon:yes gene_type:complete
MALPPNMMVAPGLDLEDTAGLPDLEVEIASPEMFEGGAEVIDDGEGGAIVQAMSMANDMDQTELIPFDANLAEFLDDSTLGELSSELRSMYEEDLESRSEWETSYVNGLDLLGIKTEDRSTPFEGASGITHPLVAESVTQFQAQAYKELLPAGGPVRTSVLGLKDLAREEQATRVKDFMNYQITEVMEEYDPDMDQMLFYLPLSGSTFKKVYFDPTRQRAVSKFIPAQDLVVPYSASDLQTASRVTHVLRMDVNEVAKMQYAGVYRDVDLKASESIEESPVRQKVNELEGLSKNYSEDVLTVLEFHAALDIEGFEDIDPMTGEPTGINLPYIVTLDHSSGQVLAIRRNYEETDILKRKRQYFVHYKFMPGLGFYGFGLIHMIGGLGRAATSLLRQLIDAGTLANLPAGFKARGVRVRNSDEPLQPGEWRDIDAPGGSIRDAIVPLPYKEPSAALASMLGGLVNDGRRFVALADQQMADMGNETPVGTTVAMLERGMKVMSAIHKRMHYAQKTEFRLLARIFAENLPPMYPYEVAGAPAQVKVEDFDARVDVLPVSDPNIFSMSQRVTLAQTQLQLAQSNPQMHNLHAAYRRMYQALEVQNIDEILPPQPQPQPQDPASENAAMLGGQTPQAFPQQDHDAHIQAHVSLLELNILQQTPPVLAALFSHVLQHVHMKARTMVQQEIEQMQMQQQQQMEQGMAQMQALAQTGAIRPEIAQQQIQQMQMQGQQQGQMPPDQIEARVAQLETELLQQVMPLLTNKGADGEEQDPLVTIRMQELAIKQMEAEQKSQMEQAKLQLDQMKLQQQATTDSARLELQEQIADERSDVNRERIDVQRQAMEQRNAFRSEG